MTLRIYKEMAAKINVTTRYPLEKNCGLYRASQKE